MIQSIPTAPLVPLLLTLLTFSPGSGAEETGNLTTGCGSPAPDATPASVEVDGRERKFILALPKGYDPQSPHRLVFGFHGRTASNDRVRKYFRLEANSRRPTIFVYPAGLAAADGKFSWYERGDSGDELRDYAFFDALLDELGRRYCIDFDQIFAVGHSLGGSFVNSLGCARGAELRGVATVAGRIWDGKCSGPAAAMIMHNPHDDLVPFERGLKARNHALVQNGLQPPSRECELRSLKCQCYGPPEAENPVVWCPHTEDRNRRGAFYPHLWPREAGASIMAFFNGLTQSSGRIDEAPTTK